MITFRVGAIVVFQAQKQTVHPGPRAKELRAQAHGELYSYVVDKYWIVAEVKGDQLLCLTRGGKAHVVIPGELRQAHWWERLVQRQRIGNLRSKLTAWQSEQSRPEQSKP